MDIIETVVTVRGTEALEKAVAREITLSEDKDELDKLIATLAVDYPAKKDK